MNLLDSDYNLEASGLECKTLKYTHTGRMSTMSDFKIGTMNWDIDHDLVTIRTVLSPYCWETFSNETRAA